MKGYDDISRTLVDSDILELKDSLKQLQVQKRRRNSSAGSPKSPRSPKSEKKCGRPANPIPRHKRDSHIKAEHRRRDKIQKGFETLRTLVPELEDAPAKESKAVMLMKTAEHCRKLKGDYKTLSDQEAALRREIEALGNQIHELQTQLPAGGLDEVEKPAANIDTMYENYVKSRMRKNWKFWMFDFLIRPLFDSFKTMVTTNTSEEFHRSVSNWVKEKLALPTLRRGFVLALMNFSNASCILDNPTKLEQQALEKVENECNAESSPLKTAASDCGTSVDPAPSASHFPNSDVVVVGEQQMNGDAKVEVSWPALEDDLPVFTQNDIQFFNDAAMSMSHCPISASVDSVTSHADFDMTVTDSFLQALTMPEFGMPVDHQDGLTSMTHGMTPLTHGDPLLTMSHCTPHNDSMIYTTNAGQSFHNVHQSIAHTTLTTEIKLPSFLENLDMHS